MFSAIRAYLAYQGSKYIKPEKAGDLRDTMLEFRRLGQAARQEFTALAQSVQNRHPDLELHATSQWMNQAQVLRPHFWAYLQGDGQLSQPMFALRLYGNLDNFGVSLEVSFLERKKDEESLVRQARILNLPVTAPVYYLAQENGESRRLDGTEANRQYLQAAVAAGRIRKVLVKLDVPLHEAESREQILDRLDEAFQTLWPYYQDTRDV